MLIMLWCLPARAIDAFEIDADTPSVLLEGYVEVYVDETGSHSFESVRTAAFQEAPAKVKTQPNMPTWLRFGLENTQSEPIERSVYLNAPSLDVADFYLLGEGLDPSPRHQGEAVPFIMKPNAGNYPQTMVVVPPNSLVQVYVLVQDWRPRSVPVRVISHTDLQIHERRAFFMNGQVAGLCLIYVLLGFVLFVRTKNRIFLWLTATNLIYIPFSMTNTGFIRVFYPEGISSWWLNQGSPSLV